MFPGLFPSAVSSLHSLTLSGTGWHGMIFCGTAWCELILNGTHEQRKHCLAQVGKSGQLVLPDMD